MKINMPVTGNECTFNKDEDLITTTDLKGAITYYNDHFYRISGFEKDELLNKNHNVVRHPDMPPAAFEDLWRTVKSGNSWMGIVKNRCKSGDHYYVDAYVTPISEKGQIVEYQSVRITPDRQYVNRAEAIYTRLRAGKSPFMPWSRLGITSKVTAGLGAMMLATLGLAMQFREIPPIATGIGAAIGLLIAYVLARFITRPIRELAAKTRTVIDDPVARQVYGGSQDEVAQIRTTLHMKCLEVNSVVARLNDSSDQLTEIAETTTQMARESSEGVALQQSEIDQMATAMNEMASTVQEVARNTSVAAQSAQDAEQLVTSGKQEVMATVKSISQVAQEVKQASDVVSRLQDESKTIGTVLDVIRGIAEQTNLLALNAAIEAARAGEQGRGFAVVADEVRSLAQRTQESTQEIQSMIEAMQTGAANAVNAMDAGRTQVEGSVKQAEKAGESLDKIAEIAGTILNMNIQIASATEEQSSVSEEMNRNVINISGAAEQNANRSQQTQETVDQLDNFARNLHALISQFRMVDEIRK